MEVSKVIGGTPRNHLKSLGRDLDFKPFQPQGDFFGSPNLGRIRHLCIYVDHPTVGKFKNTTS